MALDGALVSDAHLRALLDDGRARCRLEGYEIIQSAPTAYVVDEARGVRNPSGMFCQRIGVAMHAVAVKPSPLQNLKLAVERCHLNVVGHAVLGLCLGPCHLDRGRKADRRHRDRHGRRLHLHRRVPGRPSGPCRCGADGRLHRHHRHRPHAGGAALRRRAGQDPVRRGAGRHGSRHRRGRRSPDGRGWRRGGAARAPLDADPHHPGAPGRDFRAKCRSACRRPASTSPRAAAPC